MFSKFKKLIVMTIACTFVGSMATSAEATWWLWRRWTQPACAPACNTCYRPATTCNPCTTVRRVCRYVPQTCYRTVCVNVPVTTYKPVTTCDPCTGCRRTCWRPTTTYVRQARRVAYTTYRPVVQYVRYRATSCCTTNACGVGGCSTGHCATGHCASGNCGTGIVTTPSTGLSQPTLNKPVTKNQEQSVKKPTTETNQKKLNNSVKPIPDNSTQTGPALNLRPVRSPRIYRSNRSNKTAMAPSKEAWNYTPVSWAQPTVKPQQPISKKPVVIKPVVKTPVVKKQIVQDDRDASGWVVSQD